LSGCRALRDASPQMNLEPGGSRADAISCRRSSSTVLLRTTRAASGPPEAGDHSCLNLRLRTTGGLYSWAFEKKGRALKVHVRGPLIFNTIDLIRNWSQRSINSITT
jgi:hypothetical protein